MIKVIKLSDVIKYLLRILIPIIILVIIFQAFSKVKKAKLIEDNLSTIIMESENNDNKEKEEKNKKYAFLSELEIMESLKIAEEKEPDNEENNENNNQNNNKINNSEGVVQARTDITTEVIPNAVNPRHTNEYKGVKINNSTDFNLTEEMLTPDIQVNKSKVAIYHTHTCESYTATENFNYTPSGNYRSTDLNFSVARVGDELEKQLNSYGINVIHDKTYHDYPAYNGSYGRSLVTAEKILSENNDTDIIIDLHRDAIADESYAPKVKIGDEYASQLMFVMGTNGAGSAHNNWNQNLKFAIKVMLKANELYPGLFKPIILRNTEYNQHIAKASCIIEVGSTGNTLEESMNSMKYLAKILNEF